MIILLKEYSLSYYPFKQMVTIHEDANKYQKTLFLHCLAHTKDLNIEDPVCPKDQFYGFVRNLLYLHGVTEIHLEVDNGQSVTTKVHKGSGK